MWTRKPDALSWETAEAWSWLSTLGIAEVRGPFETLTVTVVPTGWYVPPGGLVETTVSAGWFESTLWRATANPAACSSEFAVAKLCPTTLGAAIGFGPFETFSVTFVPWSTDAPSVGAWLT